MNKLSDVIKASGLTLTYEQVFTIEPRFIFNDDDYKHAYRVTIANGDKTMTTYFFGGNGDFNVASVVENLLRDFRVNFTYTAKEWLEELGVPADEWENRYKDELRGRRIQKEYKTAFLALVGRGMYLQMIRAEDDI